MGNKGRSEDKDSAQMQNRDGDINEIRSRIDAVDTRLLEAFCERMRLSEQVAAYKQQNRLPLEDIEREQAVIDKVSEDSGAYGHYAEELFRTLIRLSKEYQREVIGGKTV